MKCARIAACLLLIGAASPRPLLIESRGVVMPFAQARRQLAFAPWMPRAKTIAVALIPPLGGNDARTTHGIAMEYEDGGAKFLLSQWPRNGFPVGVGAFIVATRPCAPVAYKADGLLWATRSGLVMTLQPDGADGIPMLGSQARRLLAAGRCPMTRLLRPARPRRPAFSSPRQSAS